MLFNSRPVAILLSTYNSAKYLSEQLDSLISQSYTDWTLYVRDDGSTDSTLDILSSYTQRCNRIVIYEDHLSNLGAAKSFMTLLSEVESDYYMFCDHDDIWLPNKIMVEMGYIVELARVHPSVPLLIGTDLNVVDCECRMISSSLFQYAKVPIDRILANRRYLFVVNPFVGCTLLFNSAAKKVSFPLDDDIVMHDWWIALKVNESGFCDIIERSTLLYRQHLSNVIGTQPVVNSFGYWIRKISRIYSSIIVNKRNLKMLKKLHYCSFAEYIVLKIKYLLIR